MQGGNQSYHILLVWYTFLSYISVVQNGHRVYLHTLSNTACQRLHKTGTLSIGEGTIISGASLNSMTTSSINFAESTTMDGRCSGTQYSDLYGTWDTVVVQATIKINLRDFEVPIECASLHLILSSGQRCGQTRKIPRHGEWTNFLAGVPQDSCQFD